MRYEENIELIREACVLASTGDLELVNADGSSQHDSQLYLYEIHDTHNNVLRFYLKNSYKTVFVYSTIDNLVSISTGELRYYKTSVNVNEEELFQQNLVKDYYLEFEDLQNVKTLVKYVLDNQIGEIKW